MRETDFSTQFTQKQLPIHDKTKKCAFIMTARGIIRGTNEILPKN